LYGIGNILARDLTGRHVTIPRDAVVTIGKTKAKIPA